MSRGGKPILGSYYGSIDFSYDNNPISSDALKQHNVPNNMNPWQPDYDVRNAYKSTNISPITGNSTNSTDVE